MSKGDKTGQKPLWLSIEESLLALNASDLEGNAREAAIRRVADELDNAGYNVSGSGGNLLQVRWAMEEMQQAGKPLMRAFNDAVAAFSLEDLIDPYAATNKLIDDLGKTWPALKQSERRPVVIGMIEEARLDLLVKEATGKSGDEGIRYLIEEEVASEVITGRLGITDDKLAEVNAQIEKEKAELARVESLLEAVADKSMEEKVRHLFDNDVAESLIIEMAGADQGAIDGVKQAMEEELKEKQRLEEEAAERKKAEAEGPSLDGIPAEEMIDYIDSVREILEFSDVEKEIRVMCEQSAIPKALVDIAVSDPDKLDELEKAAEG